MHEIKFYTSTSKAWKLIGISSLFVILGVWMILSESYGTKAYIMGWLGVVFFGLGVVIGVFSVFDKRAKLCINSNGIWAKNTKQDEIKWEQILQVNLFNINGQHFISIKTDDTFAFKKKVHKWVKKINTLTGAQDFNISLSQLDADSNKLLDLINRLHNANEKERLSIIQAYNFNKGTYHQSKKPLFLLYILILVVLLFITFNIPDAFMPMIVIMGISAIIARWYERSLTTAKWVKYARIITILGFTNMVLFLITIKSYDYISNNVTVKITISLEDYKNDKQKYPSSLNTIKIYLDLNIIENYFFNKIDYSPTVTDYKLKRNNLLNRKEVYNPKLNKWE
jgi:hypothetical protein